MESIKKYFKLFLLAVAVVILTTVLIRACRKAVKETKTEKQENIQVVENTAKSDSLETVASTLQNQLYKAHEKQKADSIASKRLVSYWKNKALTSRAKVDTLIQDNPDLKEAFEDSDSLLAVTEQRNEALEKEKEKQWGDFNKVISITEEQLKLQQETSAILAGQRDKYKRKADKRFTAGPYVGVDYRLKPSIGIAVTYRVFRF